MSKQTVFLVGATGETGASILDALLEDGSFVSAQSHLGIARHTHVHTYTQSQSFVVGHLIP